eukprot:TRINITY_DN63626_c0_g1_i1.p1 TRINITY_DN63626_c0_g1~~TRINITY_DN63626_c0_g1_i1.p1  ORF type:complete len:236 (-),score=54.03 TRINITY_DN63626_c0_g1_i1:240-947(-)
MVDRDLFESHFGQAFAEDADADLAGAVAAERAPPAKAVEGGAPLSDVRSPPARWRRFEGAAARSTVRFAVAFPVSAAAMAAMRPPFVVLDDLCSASNVGQILRTAYHFGVTSIVASRAAWNSLNGRACRVSMGWMYFMDFYLADPLPEALAELKRMGVRIYAAENQHAEDVKPHEPFGDRRWALLLGHEGLGVSAAAAALSDAHVRIPQEQGLCLNVAHAAAICIYELSKSHKRS